MEVIVLESTDQKMSLSLALFILVVRRKSQV